MLEILERGNQDKFEDWTLAGPGQCPLEGLDAIGDEIRSKCFALVSGELPRETEVRSKLRAGERMSSRVQNPVLESGNQDRSKCYALVSGELPRVTEVKVEAACW